MKKFFVLSIIFLSLFAFRNQILLPHKRYLKKESMLKYLKKERFLAKKTPVWMREQIDEDFCGVEAVRIQDVDQVFSELKHFYPSIIRYRIIDNQLFRYFPENSKLTIEDNHTEKAIKTLMKKIRLPNMDFIVSFFDACPFGGVLPKELAAPIFVPAKLKGVKNAILIPDERSVGPWWLSEIREIRKNRVDWGKKKESAFWRGGYTKEIRRELCKLSLQNPNYLDARFVRSGPRETALEKEGLLGKRSTCSDLLTYKYLPYVDGVMCATPAMQARLFSQSVTFKPDSDEVQWFYRSLKPYVHYIPVNSDLSNLIEKFDWAKENDEICKNISEQAFEFAKENLMYGDICKYLFLILTRYASHQSLNEKELKKGTLEDSHWVKIQYHNLSPFLQKYDQFTLAR